MGCWIGESPGLERIKKERGGPQTYLLSFKKGMQVNSGGCFSVSLQESQNLTTSFVKCSEPRGDVLSGGPEMSLQSLSPDWLWSSKHVNF